MRLVTIIIPFFLLVHVVFGSGTSNLTSRKLAQAFGVEHHNPLLIIGVSKGDCDLHTLELGKICHYLNNINHENVVFLCDFSSSLNSYLEKKYGVSIAEDKVVYSDSLFNILSSDVGGMSFFTVATAESVKTSHQGTFFEATNLIEQKYDIAIQSQVPLSIPIPDFTVTSFSCESSFTVLFDYLNQAVLSYSNEDGSLLGSITSELQLNDNVVSTLLSEKDAEYTRLMVQKNTYKQLGLTQYKLTGMSSTEAYIFLCIDFYYFEENPKEPIIRHIPFFIRLDKALTLSSASIISIEKAGDPIRRKHFLALMETNHEFFQDKLYAINLYSPKARKKRIMTIAPVKNSKVVISESTFIKASKTIAKETLKSKVTPPHGVKENGSIAYCYHQDVPLVVIASTIEPIEIRLQSPEFSNTDKLSAKDNFYIIDLTTTKNQRIFTKTRSGETIYIRMFDEQGKLLFNNPIAQITERPDVSTESIKDHYITITSDGTGQRYITTFVAW